MEIRQLSCPSCGGPLPVPSGAEAVTCEYCSAQLAVTWDGDQPDVRPDDTLSISIEMSGSGIRTQIRGRDTVVLPELRRDQLEAELSSLQEELANVQAKMRSLERRTRDGTVGRQLQVLSGQESSLKGGILSIQEALDARPATVAQAQPETTPSPLARVAPPAPRGRRRSRSPIGLILIGAPLLVSGGVCLLLFGLAQLTGEGAPTENLRGFAAAVVLCPVPLLAMGGILTVIGALRYLRRPGAS